LPSEYFPSQTLALLNILSSLGEVVKGGLVVDPDIVVKAALKSNGFLGTSGSIGIVN
jgi:hypothetical protein